MFYDYAITVPANTTKSDPQETELRLCHGYIHRIEVQFPIGTRALTHCRLLHHSFGQLPTNIEGSFATDGYVIPINSPLEFYKAPYVVKAVTWNDDDTYDHTVTVRFDIAESKSAIMIVNILNGLAKLLNFMGIKV